MRLATPNKNPINFIIGLFVEGVILCNKSKEFFKNIPPRLALALAMNERHEKPWADN